MSNAPHIEPKADEVIVWRHGAGRAIPAKRMSEKEIKRWNWAFRIVWVVWAVYWFSRPSVGEHLQSRSGLISTVLTLLVLFLIPKITPFLGRIIQSKDSFVPRAFPIWMSKTRLVFSSGADGIENELNLDDIQTVAQDYDGGSPALVLTSSTAKLKLITSEFIPLRDKLFTLRPDLQETS